MNTTKKTAFGIVGAAGAALLTVGFASPAMAATDVETNDSHDSTATHLLSGSEFTDLFGIGDVTNASPIALAPEISTGDIASGNATASGNDVTAPVASGNETNAGNGNEANVGNGSGNGNSVGNVTNDVSDVVDTTTDATTDVTTDVKDVVKDVTNAVDADAIVEDVTDSVDLDNILGR
ncbi:hypothetical protein [Homoserinibacter sp. YIM 151385]|uniref:hypothetical protein n=1 Tax=Homoserinibacter sp. YIM 151385 TaxID=2985506 RepID=UPI0022F10D7C|nr:hypothetical protein [Homoserinibacter sp. YIM 151385]WBU37046.1 hypothetical protein OF852_08915 [Homoserinibacter sp. YIM 151385]